ncbi:MAG: hypothetical protein CM15mP102_18160 [Flavobacteriales bacterium]|nr:MAG: hypothetical protein CM15mP102_18160 [Flavobacteriales bacterium]
MWDTQFNKRAVFWLAAQTAVKAGRVDASLKKISIELLLHLTEELLPRQIFLQRKPGNKYYFLMLD